MKTNFKLIKTKKNSPFNENQAKLGLPISQASILFTANAEGGLIPSTHSTIHINNKMKQTNYILASLARA